MGIVSDEIDILSEVEEESDSDSELQTSSITRPATQTEIECAAPDESDDDVSSLSGLPRHFRCASHTLNLLATTDVLKTVKASVLLSSHFDQVMERCQCLWKLLRSPKQREILTNILGECLSRPVVVRWYSLFTSLEQIYKLREKITDGSEVLGITTPLSGSDFKFIAEYLTCLRPVAHAIEVLQGEKECSYGYLLPNIISLRRKLQSVQMQGNLECCQRIVAEMIENLQRRFHDFFVIEGNGKFAAVAAVLQPEFKMRWVKFLSPTAQGRVKDAVVEVAKEASIRLPRPEVHEPRRNDDYDFGDEDQIVAAVISPLLESKTELQMRTFLNDPPCTDISVINHYPEIKDLFLKYNTPLPSSAPVERLFSYATMINLPRYNRLTDENFEIRTLAKCNAGNLLT